MMRATSTTTQTISITRDEPVSMGLNPVETHTTVMIVS